MFALILLKRKNIFHISHNMLLPHELHFLAEKLKKNLLFPNRKPDIISLMQKFFLPEKRCMNFRVLLP